MGDIRITKRMLQMDMQQTCRACLSQLRGSKEPLFGSTLFNLFKQCTHLKPEDDNVMPKFLCTKCQSFCAAWSIFKENCIQNEHILREIIKMRTPITGCFSNYSIEEDQETSIQCTDCGLYLAKESKLDHVCLEAKMPKLESRVDDLIENDPLEPCEKDGKVIEADDDPNGGDCDEVNEDSESCDESNEDSDPQSNPGKRKTGVERKEPKKRGRKPTLDTICKQCGMAFKRPNYLRKHELSHTIVKDPRCLKCNRSFSSATALEEHCTDDHQMDILKNFSCMFCDGMFATYGMLIKHMYTHEQALEVLPNNKYQCPKCDCTKSSSILLEKHIEKCVPFSHTCTTCGHIAKNATLLKTHMRSHNVREHLCSTCGKAFKTKNLLRNHFALHVGKTDKCDLCQQYFSGPLRLKYHIERVHSTTKRMLCHVCSVDFKDPIAFRAHVALHENPNLHQCKKCQSVFQVQLQFENHVIKCRGRMRQNSRVRIETVRVMCSVCGDGFPTLPALRLHLMELHAKDGVDIEAAIESIKNIKCDLCDKRFASHKNLKLHMNVHSSNKPFECDYCDKTFRDATNLRYHMVAHEKREESFCNSQQQSDQHAQFDNIMGISQF